MLGHEVGKIANISVTILTRPSSDSEAVTMYKLNGQSLDMRTGQGFKYKELVPVAGQSSWSVYKVKMLQSQK